MNKLDKQYTDLLKTILEYGVDKKDRTGTGTKSIFGYTIRHNMKDGFPLLTTKKMPFKTIVTELLWFLRGDTNIKYLVDNNCHIWDGDAYQAYLKNWKPQPVVENELHWLEQELVSDRPLPKDMFIHCIKTDAEFAKKWGELGPVYGKQWRSWKSFEHEYGEDENGDGFIGMWKGKEKIDQIQNLINDLKTNPDSRRLMVSAWNVGELDSMVLPPCHYGFQVYTRELSNDERIDYALSKNDFRFTDAIINQEDYEKYNIPTRAISLMFNMRSNDVPLGLPFNLASYGLLLEILSKEVNMVPDELIASLGDAHIYVNQIDGVKEQLKREPYQLPQIKLDDWYSTQGDVNNSTEIIMGCLMGLNHGHITLENYQSHPTIKMPLSN